MWKRFFVLLLTLFFLLPLGACQRQNDDKSPSGGYKIAIYTNDTNLGEEEILSGERAIFMYGKDRIIHGKILGNYHNDQPVVILNGMRLIKDPNVKVFIMNQAVTGASELFAQIREERPDMLLIACNPMEISNPPAEIVSSEKTTLPAIANIIMEEDYLAQARLAPEQAVKMGAKTFIYYTFHHQRSFAHTKELLNLTKESCRELGITFIHTPIQDAHSANSPAAQTLLLEDIPSKVAEYGPDTNFFCFSSVMQSVLIHSAVKTGAIYTSSCSGPWHGFPEALNLAVPKEKAWDARWFHEQVSERLAGEYPDAYFIKPDFSYRYELPDDFPPAPGALPAGRYLSVC